MVKKEVVEETSKKRRHGKLCLYVVILKKGGRGLTSVMIRIRQLKWRTEGIYSKQEKSSGGKD